MDISVAICTWNHARLLDQTLSEMANLVVRPSLKWELLIIDNNCTDDTSAVVQKHIGALPIRYVLEPRQGQSNARNRALQEAQSDWVIFTDDDVLVDPKWLATYEKAAGDAGDDVVLLGGDIVPYFPEEPDPALVQAMPMVGDGFCARKVPSDLCITNQSTYLPLGANFGLRKSLLSDVRFNPRLGASKNSRILGEEVALFQHLLSKGLKGSWVSDAGVRHYVDPSRLKLRSLRRQLFGMGRQTVRKNGPPAGRTLVAGMPAWVYRSTLVSGVEMTAALILRRKLWFYESFNRFWQYWGVLYEHFASSRLRGSTDNSNLGGDIRSQDGVERTGGPR